MDYKSQLTPTGCKAAYYPGANGYAVTVLTAAQVGLPVTIPGSTTEIPCLTG